ncbi:MAG TPA: TfoX/Sxy family protein [Saprospiraceae bacterium]|nr:TfoX/Sxy family protein [Saprospiraceae bacterium]HPK09781.1 TfoX/Sxy family protein [Saprospiraceae bacterium]HPQ20743.1 TfoX/Sxy family protein [Saprospiraceae bacterium]
MASTQDFAGYIASQIDNAGEIVTKKMFGEYGIYSDGKIFGSICDNKFFVKPTDAGREFIGNVTEAPPYPGAKPNFLIEENLDNRDWMSQLVRLTVAELPMPKPKKSNKKSK